jgi:AraC family transcriptional activator FtrA
MPNTSGPLVVALLYDGLCTFEYGIVTEIFGLPRPELGPGWYRFESCAIEPGLLRAHGGLLFQAKSDLGLLEQADLIVVPGWKGADIPVADHLCDRLRAAHRRGARLASICSGAFVLAATGMLDGKTATTHWRYAERLREKYPDVLVDERSLYSHADGIYTSAGSAAGIDLLIEIVRRDFGPVAANSVARRIVMPAHRNGGQAQFLERPVGLRDDVQIGPSIEWIRARVSEPWPVERMAELARMSTRTFLRRFSEAVGTTPGEWLIGERLERAKELLLTTAGTIDQIAHEVGWGNAHTLRQQFRRKIGLSPNEFRSRFALQCDIKSIA